MLVATAHSTEKTASGKPSVLVVGNFLSASTGVKSICEDLSEHLSAAGWGVIRTSYHRNRLPRAYDMVRTVWKERATYQVAHVEVYSGLAFIWAEMVCASLALLGKPAVLTLHGGNLPRFAKKWPGRVRRLLNSAWAVTTPSSFLLERMRPCRDDLRLIPNPINIKFYNFRLQNKTEPHLVWLRAFHRMYNPSLAPKMISHLIDEYPQLRMVMIGPDKGDGSLQAARQTAAEYRVEGHIVFARAITKDQVPARLAEASIFINTTNVDNVPISVIEAMACGLCVVSTNVGGIPYLLEDGVDALLVPPDDPVAMANAVRRLLKDPDLAGRISANARRKAESFDWAVILPQWEQLLIEGVETRSDV